MVRSRKACPGQAHSAWPRSRPAARRGRSGSLSGWAARPWRPPVPTAATSSPTAGPGHRRHRGSVDVSDGGGARAGPARSGCRAGPGPRRRRSPMPLRNFTGVSSLSAAMRARQGGHRVGPLPTGRRVGEQLFGESGRHRTAPDRPRPPPPRETAPAPQLPAKRDDRAAPGAAVQLGHHEPGRRYRLGEELALLDRVLAHRAVEHQQASWGAPGRFRAITRTDLPELLHQTFLGVEPAGGVHQHQVCAPRVPASIPSKATAAGSPPGAPITHGT